MTVTLGLMLTAFAFGLRHGIDWDHIAALGDLSVSGNWRRSLSLSTLYAAGHATVVILLGSAAVVLAAELPPWVDRSMEQVVGATLLVLAGFVLVALVRGGRSALPRSRAMLLASMAQRGRRRLRRPRALDLVEIEHEHEHGHDATHEHTHVDTVDGPTSVATADLAGGRTARALPNAATVHRHRHHHVVVLPSDPDAAAERRLAVVVGVLHGVGAETPTQVAAFAVAAGVGGNAGGLLLLLAFVTGLFTANTMIALTAAAGFLGSARNRRLRLVVSAATAAFSGALGALLVTGHGDVLPPLFGA